MSPSFNPPYHGVVILDDAATRSRNTYRDGGTLGVNVVLNTTTTMVFRDRRTSSTTRGQWFDRYPGHIGATRLPLELEEHLDRWILEHS